MALPQWTLQTGSELASLNERVNVEINIPLAETTGITVAVIAGALPTGLRIDNNKIKGVPFEVARTTNFEFVLRATSSDGIADRTFTINVQGADAPVWQTPVGALNLNTTLRNQYWVDITNSQFGVLSTINYVTYIVTVASGTNQYGTGNKYYVEGFSGASPVLELKEGSTYKFDLSSSTVSTHGLRFSTTPNGTWASGIEYTTGVTVVGNAGDTGAYVQIVVPKGSPTLYYYCINHSGMGNTANTPNTFTNVSITTTYTSIPGNAVGAVGDVAFISSIEEYWYRHTDRWYKMSSSQLNAIGNYTLFVGTTVPSVNTTDFWFNTNELLTGGFNLGLKFYDDTVPVWKPVDYTVSTTAPISPSNNDVWIQIYTTEISYKIKIYNDSENNWEILNPVYSTTPPDRVNKSFFVLDSSLVDFQLQAIDTDLTTGETLKYYIADDGGTLPPGLSLSEAGRITGTVDPILALDNLADPGYDNTEYDAYGLDFKVIDDDGYDSYFYDTTFYGFSTKTRRPKKLNREYTFTITVEDEVFSNTREFKIFVVGDDFLRSDNTIMKSGTGIYTSDSTFLRRPVWLTPGNLGIKRANNYTTIYLDIFDPNTLLGTVSYNQQPFNDDGTESTLPPGLVLDGLTGEIAGNLPYQPAINKDYKFTIEALRQESDSNDLVELNAQLYEDTMSGKSSIKIYKQNTSMADGVDDLKAFIGQEISIDNNGYIVDSVSDTNTDYDLLNLKRDLEPTYKSNPLIVYKDAPIGQNYFYVNNLINDNEAYWSNKKLNFSASESYTLQNITNTVQVFNTHIEFNISSDDSANGLNWSYDDAGFDPVSGDTLTSVLSKYITNVLKYTSNDFEILSATSTDLNFIIKADSITRNVNTWKKVLYNDDSTYTTINVVKSNDFVKIPLDKVLARNITKGTQYALGVAKDTNITKRIIVGNTDSISSIKTFVVTVLGEVDSTVKWKTAANLGSIVANRISYLQLEATTSLVGGSLRYDLISGSLPNGLILKRNGEITGKANQFNNDKLNGLTFIDKGSKTWTATTSYIIGNIVSYGDILYKSLQVHTGSSSNIPGGTNSSSYWQVLSATTSFDGSTTTYDRKSKFKVMARDRFGYSASIQEFTLTITDVDSKLYSNIYMQPYPITSQRTLFNTFINDFSIFDTDYIYRPSDTNFGVQKQLRTLAYAGIEQKSINGFMSGITLNHKKKQFRFGDVKTAKAIVPGTTNVVYEVVYVEIIDPAEPAKGETALEFNARSGEKLSVNNIRYEIKDDETSTEVGQDIFAIKLKNGNDAKFNANSGSFVVVTRSANVTVDAPNGEIPVTLQSGLVVKVRSNATTTNNSGDPYRFRPRGHAVSVDSTGYLSSQGSNIRKFISNITNMRKRIAAIGANEREFLPLWMRTQQQTAVQELGYVTAMPLCYTIPGGSSIIKANIINSAFDFKNINYEIDRYIVDATAESTNEQFLLFANYALNV